MGESYLKIGKAFGWTVEYRDHFSQVLKKPSIITPDFLLVVL